MTLSGIYTKGINVLLKDSKGENAMKELLEKLSSYNIFNYLLPGIIFVVFADVFLQHSFIQKDIIFGVFLYYFIGLVISRIGSLVLEPFLEKISFLKFVSYKEFIFACKTDEKLEVLSEVNNMYRTFVALFVALLVVRIYEAAEAVWPSLKQITPFIAVLVGIILFIVSYRKQTSYITKRVEANKEVQR